LSDRVTIAMDPIGTAIVRIRATTYRRWVETAKWTLLVAAMAAAVALVRGNPDRLRFALLVVGAGLTIGVGILTFVRAGEVVVISPESVRVVLPLEAFIIARAQQARPVYSPVEPRVWAAQRWERERGSGVLLFGSRQRGLRVGVDLDAAEAREVLSAFDLVPASGDAIEFPAHRGLVAAATGVLPIAVGLGASAIVLALGANAIFAGLVGLGTAVLAGAVFERVTGARAQFISLE